VERRAAARSVRRGAPDPIPAILLGRLAVDRQHAGQGIGSGLLKDAFLRAGQVSRLAGARLLLLDALDEEARSFYLRHGFRPSPLNPLQLMHSLDLRGDLSSAEEGSQR
jgi:GNAT superfamily N-acetyltransferase